MILQKRSLMSLQGAVDEGEEVEATGVNGVASTAWRNFLILVD